MEDCSINALIEGLQMMLKPEYPESVVSLSMWLIHHKQHSGIIVQIWFEEIQKADDVRRLAYMYLATDIILICKKQGLGYIQDFENVLVATFKHLSQSASTEAKTVLRNILAHWKSWQVFDPQKIQKFYEAWSNIKIAQKRKLEETTQCCRCGAVLSNAKWHDEADPENDPDRQTRDEAIKQKIAQLLIPPDVKLQALSLIKLPRGQRICLFKSLLKKVSCWKQIDEIYLSTYMNGDQKNKGEHYGTVLPDFNY